MPRGTHIQGRGSNIKRNKGSRRRPLPYGPQKPPLSVVSDPYENSPNQRPGSDIPFVQGWNYVWVDNLPPGVSLGMVFSGDGTCDGFQPGEGLPDGLTIYADYMPEGVTGGVCKVDRCHWQDGSCQHFFHPPLWTWWGHTDCWPLTTCEAEFECCTAIDCTCTCGNWQTGGGQTGPVLILANIPGGDTILLDGPYAGYIQRITSNLWDPCGFQDWARDGWYDW